MQFVVNNDLCVSELLMNYLIFKSSQSYSYSHQLSKLSASFYAVAGEWVSLCFHHQYETIKFQRRKQNFRKSIGAALFTYGLGL